MSAEYFRYDHTLKCHANNSFRKLIIMSTAIAVPLRMQICRLLWSATNPETSCHAGWLKQKKLVRNFLLMSSYRMAMTSFSREPRMVPSCCTVLQTPKSFQRYKFKQIYIKKVENILKRYNTSSQLIVVCQYCYITNHISNHIISQVLLDLQGLQWWSYVWDHQQWTVSCLT